MLSNYIEITEECKIMRGNFAFVYENNPNLYYECYDAEKTVFTQSQLSLSRFRILLSHIGINAEIEARLIKQRISNDEKEKERKRIEKELEEEIKDIKNTKSQEKILFCNAFKNNINKQKLDETAKKLKKVFKDIPIEATWKRLTKFDIIVNQLYSICSEKASHNNESSIELSEKVCYVMYELVSLLYKNMKSFDINSIPFDDYIPIPISLYEKLNIGDKELRLYVKEIDRQLNYYIFRKVDNKGGSLINKRNREILNTLWFDSLSNPDNIIYLSEDIGEEGCKYQVMRLPSRPESLNLVIKNEALSKDEKMSVIKSIIESVKCLHTANPKITHRFLSPTSFFICRGTKGIKVIMYDLGLAKEIGAESDYTVMHEINRKSNIGIWAPYVAPELLEGKLYEDYADRADIFSLGKTIEFIDDTHDLIDDELIRKMCDTDYKTRPDIRNVEAIINNSKLLFSYTIGTQRSTRRKQQDGFWLKGYNTFLADYDIHSDEVLGSFACAIFDGLGGARNGAAMSEYAARFTDEYFGKSIRSNYDKLLNDYVDKLQASIRRYMEEMNIDYSGTTMVVAIFDGESVYLANIGDSRAYLIDENGIFMLTHDHRYSMGIKKKGELYQYIGMDEAEGKLKPYLSNCLIKPGNYIILCSDGLTDYVVDDEIKEVVNSSIKISEKNQKLIEMARKNGSRDDITIIVVEVNYNA